MKKENQNIQENLYTKETLLQLTVMYTNLQNIANNRRFDKSLQE